MRWGRKKPSSSSSSRPSLISHVLPSWITKIKQMGVNSGQEYEETKTKGKWNSVSISSPCYANGGGGGKFYGGDGDAYWRLSFGEDAVDGKMKRRGTQSVLYNSDDELEFPPSCCQSCRSNVAVDGQEDTFKFSDMVSEVRKTRGFPRGVTALPEIEVPRSQKMAEIRKPGLRIERDKNIKRRNQRITKEKELELHGKSSEADLGRAIEVIQREACELKASDRRRSRYMPSVNSGEPYLNKTEKECAFSSQGESGRVPADNLCSEWQKMKETKIEELKSKCVKQRKSLYISRELERKKPKQQSKVRAYSPRTATKIETCRIKALEDMKKAKLKMKKKAKENAMEGLTELESFALVKCSYDPQEDFRESMIEMIKERRINKPEELEELLACYLTLNSDDYHNLIIKVFRQVWFDLNQGCFHTGLEND